MAERTEREVLNTLIETCRDGELGFRVAAEHVTDPALRTMFAGFAEERARWAADLLPHAQRLGGAATTDGTHLGTLHRRWLDLKSSISHHSDHGIVAEVSRGDRATVHAYKDAIEGILPPDARDLIEQQYTMLQQEHDRLVDVQGGNHAA